MSGIYINHNALATSTANTLSDHYSDLAVSTKRLSSGLRINSAVDDAAGLAIRELQRADIAALNQGVRNANDAISMIQTFDGALSVIDEKLIRMKELAEQAATGTYDSTQRLMIDSEFQAMGSEINRIARATDFNGIKMLNGETSPTMTIRVQIGEQTGHVATAATASAGGAATTNNGANVAINTQNVTASKYNALLPTQPDGVVNGTKQVDLTATVKTGEIVNEPKGGPNFDYTITAIETWPNLGTILTDNFSFIYSGPTNSTGAGTWTLKDNNGTTLGSTQLGNVIVNGNVVTWGGVLPNTTRVASIMINVLSYEGNTVTNLNNLYGHGNTTGLTISNNGTTYQREITYDVPKITLASNMGTATYDTATNNITANLGNGDRVVLGYTPDGSGYISNGEKISFALNVAGNAETKTVPIYEERVVPVGDVEGIPDTLVRIHFGPMNDRKEDYYDINKHDATLEGLGLNGVQIKTQNQAQEALVQIDDAIVRKDNIRAEYGAMQNRLENTITNLTIQSESTQAAESRISDADIAHEMMSFVTNQILTQSAVAMLAQANNIPQMVMRLIAA